jgi:valyl-tRNA synthetase
MSAGFELLAGAGEVEYGEDVVKEKGCASSPVGEYEVIVPLGGLADVEAEIRRLTREKEKLESALAIVEKKLSKKDFLEKAKEEVVRKEREKKVLLETELHKIRESLEVIQNMG